MPRTNVVLPEPNGPASSTRSPGLRRSPSASVAAAEVVVSSRKVVVTRNPFGMVDHLVLFGELAHLLQARRRHQLVRADAAQLHLFATGQRIGARGAWCDRDAFGLQRVAHTGHRRELVELPDEPVG